MSVIDVPSVAKLPPLPPAALREAFAVHEITTIALAVLTLATGCTHAPRFEARALAAAERLAVREQVRELAKTRCGMCHQASRPTALPAALAIYNLDSENWSQTLSASQLRGGFPRRLNPQLDEAARRQLRGFIESELALRKEQEP